MTCGQEYGPPGETAGRRYAGSSDCGCGRCCGEAWLHVQHLVLLLLRALSGARPRYREVIA